MINEIVEKITLKIKETQDEFIFQTILPYCSEIMERKISKKVLIDALRNWENCKLHNLERDPKDLPQNNRDVFVKCKDGKYYTGYFDIGKEVWLLYTPDLNEPWDSVESELAMNEVIAWRDINMRGGIDG